MQMSPWVNENSLFTLYRQEETDSNRRIDSARRQLERFRDSQRDRLLRFGSWVPSVVGRINALAGQNKFHKTPIGPLGKQILLLCMILCIRHAPKLPRNSPEKCRPALRDETFILQRVSHALNCVELTVGRQIYLEILFGFDPVFKVSGWGSTKKIFHNLRTECLVSLT